MHYLHNPPVKRQATDPPIVPSVSGVLGGTTAVSGIDPGTSLLLGASATSLPSVSIPLVAGQPVITFTSGPPSIETNAASLPPPPSISTGGIVGIIFGIFMVVVGAMFAIYAYFKKRTAAMGRQPLTRRLPPVASGIGGARGHGHEKQLRVDGVEVRERRARPPSGALLAVNPKSPDSAKFGLFEKEPSLHTVSEEKTNNHTFDPSSMPNFAKYHSDHTDDLSMPPTRPFASHGAASPVTSWDGETINGDPFISLHVSRSSDTMSPSSVLARQTPRTTDSVQHRWESAEVLMMDEAPAERTSEALENPFDDDVGSRRAGSHHNLEERGGGNPFFNASQHNPFSDRPSVRSRKSSVSTVKRARSDSASSRATASAGPSGGALLSLIAALDGAPAIPDGHNNRSSMHTMTSIYTPTMASQFAPTR
ncbi:hypothetical protein F5148DRAFT_1147997 [Russula earlei]|uniref:Uncharacterized protein n=1 Tax=Russula earlei TaxID=71964 RepID=A0ACC0UEV9_9AGAM|nr:hypothetical protein F5148DRAFT_1147997 [Russula earlei]